MDRFTTAKFELFIRENRIHNPHAIISIKFLAIYSHGSHLEFRIILRLHYFVWVEKPSAN